jgi:hypothetical protein
MMLRPPSAPGADRIAEAGALQPWAVVRHGVGVPAFGGGEHDDGEHQGRLVRRPRIVGDEVVHQQATAGLERRKEAARQRQILRPVEMVEEVAADYDVVRGGGERRLEGAAAEPGDAVGDAALLGIMRALGTFSRSSDVAGPTAGAAGCEPYTPEPAAASGMSAERVGVEARCPRRPPRAELGIARWRR